MLHLNDTQLTACMKNLYNNSSEAIFFINRDGKVLMMNPTAKNIFDEDIIEKLHEDTLNSVCYFCKGFTNEEDLMSCTNCFILSPNSDFSSFQVYIKVKGGNIVPFTASYKLIDKENGIHVLTLLDLTKQFKTRENLYRTKMMKHVIKAQEDERKRISRELHDSVAQELLSTLVDIRVLKYMNAPEEALAKIQHTEKSITRLLDEIRNLSVELRPASLDDLGLEAAFRSHFKWVEVNYGILVYFTAELSAARYSNEIETVVYRVCQEAVLNGIKYADIDEIHVRLYEKNNELMLLVADKGAGFNIHVKEARGSGIGLYGMKERAELVNGILNIQSEVGKGTKVTLRIPLLQESATGEMLE